MQTTIYKLDRTKGRGVSFVEANDQISEWINKSPLERLEAARYLINQIYGTSANKGLNKKVFSKRKHELISK